MGMGLICCPSAVVTDCTTAPDVSTETSALTTLTAVTVADASTFKQRQLPENSATVNSVGTDQRVRKVSLFLSRFIFENMLQ